MADYKVEPTIPVNKRDGGNLLREDNLPSNRQAWGPRNKFDATPEGTAARKVFKDQYGFDYDDVSTDQVYYVGSGDSRMWYVPIARYYNPGKVRYDCHWVPTKIYRDREAEAAEQREAEGKRAEQAAQDRQDRLARQKAESQRRLAEAKDAAEQRRQEADQRLEEARLKAEEAKLQAEIRKMEAEAAAAEAEANAPPSLPPPPGVPAGLRTYEIIGRIAGRIVPLTSAIQRGPSGWAQVPGAQVTVGDAPSDGSGVAGVPGQWATYAGGQMPEAFGLDPGRGVLAQGQGAQGVRPYPMPANVLQDIFGPGWRQTVYGA